MHLEDSKIFYISDLHLLQLRNVTEIDSSLTMVTYIQKLIENWNSVVSDNDTVYVLGDIAVAEDYDNTPLNITDIRLIKKIIGKLKGKKHLILGNHDHAIRSTGIYDCFDSVRGYANILDNGNRVVLNHYPILVWDGKGIGSYMIHGHLHTRFTKQYVELYREKSTDKRLLNCGIFNVGMVPRELKELAMIQEYNINIIENNIGEEDSIFLNNYRELNIDMYKIGSDILRER